MVSYTMQPCMFALVHLFKGPLFSVALHEQYVVMFNKPYAGFTNIWLDAFSDKINIK